MRWQTADWPARRDPPLRPPPDRPGKAIGYGTPRPFPPVIADEPLPVHNVRLCRKPAAAERVRGAYQVPGAQKLPVRMEGGRAWVTVPCVRDYDLVVFDVE